MRLPRSADHGNGCPLLGAVPRFDSAGPQLILFYWFAFSVHKTINLGFSAGFGVLWQVSSVLFFLRLAARCLCVLLCSAIAATVSQITSLFEMSTLVGILLSPALLLISVVFTGTLPTFLVSRGDKF